MLYYKKVDAIQFSLTDEEKMAIAQGKPVFFEGSSVRHIGGTQYLAVLQQGENLVKVHIEQWLIRHPDGMWQVLWPDDFNRNFEAAKVDDPEFRIHRDPFAQKSYNQPTRL